MDVIFTKHAKERMIERGIKKEWVNEAIDLPDYKVSKKDKIEAYGKIQSKTLKIVYKKEGKFIKIISVMWK